MSDNEVPNDATPEALDNAANSAMGMGEMENAGGSEASGGDASYSSESEPSGSSMSGKSADNIMGDAVMDALTSASKGQTLAKKKAAMSMGVAAKGSSMAALLGTSIISGGLALSGMQVMTAILDGMADKYRVRETGNAVKAQDWAKAKGKNKSKARILEKDGQPLGYKKAQAKISGSYPRKKGMAPNVGSSADRALASRGNQISDPSTGAALQSNVSAPSVFKSKRQDMLLRLRQIKDYGDQGVQKDAKYAPKAMGQNGMQQTQGIRNDTMDKLAVNMYMMRPNNRPPALRM